jgi:serine/threonine-protein kinase
MARDLEAVLVMDLQADPPVPEAVKPQDPAFAQTLRLAPEEAGQNRRSSAEPREPHEPPTAP